MAKRKTPPRYKSGPKKGQFMPKRARAAKKAARTRKRRARSNPGRTVRSTPKRRARRRSTARRNPPKMDIMSTLYDGGVEAAQILVGKAGARSLPDLVGLPKEGNLGLAVQALAALALGFGARYAFSEETSRAVLAGGLTAPLETLVVAYQVPWLSQALSPTTAVAQVGAYVRSARPEMLGRYARGGGATAAPKPRRGLGRYATGGR